MKSTQSVLEGLPFKVRRKTGVILGERDARFVIERGATWAALVNTKADADLFAAAGELLAACKTMHQYLTDLVTHHQIDADEAATRIEACAEAIAAAKGK